MDGNISLTGLLQLDEPNGRRGGPSREQRRFMEQRRHASKRRGQRAHRRDQDKLTPEQRKFQLIQMNRVLFGLTGTPAMRRNLTRRIIGDVNILIDEQVKADPEFAISPNADPRSQRTQQARRRQAKEFQRRVDAKLVELEVDVAWAK